MACGCVDACLGRITRMTCGYMDACLGKITEWPVDAWMLEKKMLVPLWMPGCVYIRVPMVLLSDVVYDLLWIDVIGAFKDDDRMVPVLTHA